LYFYIFGVGSKIGDVCAYVRERGTCESVQVRTRGLAFQVFLRTYCMDGPSQAVISDTNMWIRFT